MRVYQAIADELVAQGVDTVFGLMGDANMYLVADLVERHGVRFVAARGENAAVMMADGYARAAGRCGVATVTQGPGLASAGNALTIAAQARTPLVLLAGDTPAGDPLHVQNFEQLPFALATAGRFVPVRSPGTARRDTAAAFRAAREAPGPVVLNAPMDLQDAEADPGEVVPRAVLAAGGRRSGPEPAPEAVEALAALLREARRPVLLAGRGAEGARDELVALADRCGAVLATTLMAAGLFAGHPYALGVAGGLARPLTREVLGEADLVIAFGAGLNRWTADHGALFPAATVACVDADPAAIGARWPVDAGVVGDAARTAGALAGASSPEPRPEWRTPGLAGRIAAADPFAGVSEVREEGRVDPRTFMRVCARRLPRDRTTVVGVGHFGGWPNLFLDSVATDRALLAPWEFGSIGVGTAFGVGAAAGRPDRPVVVFEGDGSLLTSLGELDTLARTGLPVLVVVLDDAAYGAEVRKLAPRGADPGLARFPPRDLAAVARALGVPARVAGDAEAAEAAFDALLPLRGPALLQVRVARGPVQDRF
ncbi:thiamine pyrophosphate-binding protein [Actinomadura viridis]|uniref:Thiamine pyrophosphate-dependent acetolactate synthase large subunit-like protein n=1 Tax=Actinomadura viridis TaxID=58110 RepID=A0A931DL73_9ACTN|nr:thiamine pyrophosphate-binding protein [Actinomadura viridis]MBG6091522.1 thiamine pyrophosphate-dependent acetolactate synthase large subunit-like protein [Actinomadura viridis]